MVSASRAPKVFDLRDPTRHISDDILAHIFSFVSERQQAVASGGSDAACSQGGGSLCESDSGTAGTGDTACSPSCSTTASSSSSASQQSCCTLADAPAAVAASAAAAVPQPSASTALPLVCRRWRHVYHSSSQLHGTLSLDIAQLEAQASHRPGGLGPLMSLLAQRGWAARRLWLHSEGAWLTMEGVLHLVSPKLQACYLGAGAPAASLALLHRFQQSLRSLDLPAAACGGGSSSGSECSEIGSGLAGFQRLEELTLREEGVTVALLSSLAGLSRLRLLSLTVTEALPLGQLHSQLGRLHSLEELHVYLAPAGRPARFGFQPGALSELTRLRCVLLIASSSLCESLTIGPGLPDLPALQELQVESRVDLLPPDLWACQHLTRLELDLQGSAGLPPGPTSLFFPSSSAHDTPPPVLPAMRALRLARCQLADGVLPRTLCQLGGLERLEVQRCGLASDCTHAGLPLEFSCLSNLRHLSLEGNALCTLPPSLAALRALRHLDCSCNPLAWLPPGPYLASLEALLLSSTHVTTVPSVLSAARRLEVLDLSCNPGLELSLHDVRATLARMPHLSLLLLGKQAAACPGTAPGAQPGLEWRTPSVAALVALGQSLPHLEVDFEHTAAEFEGI